MKEAEKEMIRKQSGEGKGKRMDTILNYLENMFLNLPNTSEVEKAKRELASMMEDKYNELLAEGKTDNEAVGIVISEFGNLRELAEELGISELLKEGSQASAGKHVSEQEIRNYIADNEIASKRIALGVMLCVFSPIPLIVLAGMQEKYSTISDALMASVGVGVLLGIIAIAVGIFIYNGMKLEKYEYLKKEPFFINVELVSYVKSYQDEIQQKFAFKMITGVVLCILSIIPVVVIGSFDNSNTDFAACMAVAFLLFVVGISATMFVTAGMKKEITKILLQEDDYAYKSKEGKKLIDMISGIYWPVVVCIYLGWSFITGDWQYSWVVWPIAGVFFGAISATCSAVCKKD